MKHFLTTSLILAFFSCCISPTPARAQLLKKLKEKATQVIENEIDKKIGGNTNSGNTGNPNNNPSGENRQTSGGKMANKGGGGLKNSAPPDVLAQISDADKAHQAGNFSEARYSIQQALVGVEIQLGREILRSLPDKVNDMAKDSASNVVMSNQWGWNNLTIQTVYNQPPEKQLTITIGNNSLYSGLAALYFSSAGYVQANERDQNVKQTRLKGYRAVIQYDDNKGYTLMIPLGQTSLVVWECVNFKDEDDVMKTAGAFDIDRIKKMMGEQ
jgi:hypothetical protein